MAFTDPEDEAQAGANQIPLYSDEKPSSSDEQPLEVEDVPGPLSKPAILCLNISWYGLSTMFLVLSVVVVPAQIETMVGQASKGTWLGGMVAGGAVSMFICGPLVGMFSDRLQSKYGRRRPVMLAATILVCIGLCGMALAAPQVREKVPANATDSDCHVDLVEQRCRAYGNHSLPPIKLHNSLPQEGVMVPEKHPQVFQEEDRIGNIGIFVICYLLMATGFTTATIPYNALIADKSHPQQRGLNSGVMGFMVLAGHITGATLGMFYSQLGIIGIYGIVLSLVVICVLITVTTTTEKDAKPIHQPINFKTIFLGFWEPLREHDFRWVFLTRFLMQQGVSTVTGFLEYWLADMVQLPNCWSPEKSVAILLMPLLGTAALGSILCGILSDKLARRKPLVIASAMMMFICTSIMSFTRGENAFYFAIALAFLFGSGFGCFQAVDFALVMDVLPADKDKAKDLAVWHQALILPQALATPLGGIILDVFESIDCASGLGYIIVFLITALYFFLSGIFVTKIRGVQ